MSIVGKIIKVRDRFAFYYGMDLSEGKYMVQSRSLEGIKAERNRLLKVERQADELYGYYKQGYYKGRFADLKQVFETIFTENVFYTWSLLDDWLWKLYDEAPDMEHFAYGLIQFYTGRVANNHICRHLCRTEKSLERKLEYLETSLEENGKTEDLCMVRLMRETGIRMVDLENVLWDNIQFPYVSGVMTKKTRSLYPVSQISEKTYELLKQLKKKDEMVFHRIPAAFQATVRKAVGGEFDFNIYSIRWYWLKAVAKVKIPEEDHKYVNLNPTEE